VEVVVVVAAGVEGLAETAVVVHRARRVAVVAAAAVGASKLGALR
jgi:hypothetical protein